MDELKNRIFYLPEELKYEIILFLIINPNKITFDDAEHHIISTYGYETYKNNCSYCNIYKLAYYPNYIYKKTIYKKNNNNLLFLSRITKKNNKYKYYLTKEIIKQIEYNFDKYCRYYTYVIEYSSTYIGNNIYYALLFLI
jgi:hypothetical protein